jgi:magnesium transporter
MPAVLFYTSTAMPKQPIAGFPWYDIDDPDSPELDELARKYSLHELDVEDCRKRPQRAKYTEQPHYIFCVLKHLHENERLAFDDFDLFLGRDFLITVHKGSEEVVPRAVQRLTEENVSRVDRAGYIVIDSIVDEYMPQLDRIAEETAGIEDDVLENPDPEMLRDIFELKRKLIGFRRNAAGMREVVNAIIRRENGIAADDLDPYFRDIYDHLIRTVDLVESYRDLLTSSLDIYLSAVANRTNDVMKVLTMYGTVATPLVIITGFFGMNLPLPLQERAHGTGIAIGLMVLSTIIVMLYFKRKRWF